MLKFSIAHTCILLKLQFSDLQFFIFCQILFLFICDHYDYNFIKVDILSLLKLFVYSRYRDYRNPPNTTAEPYAFSDEYWHLLSIRFAFVLIFEVSKILYYFIFNYIYRVWNYKSGYSKFRIFSKLALFFLIPKFVFEGGTKNITGQSCFK